MTKKLSKVLLAGFVLFISVSTNIKAQEYISTSSFRNPVSYIIRDIKIVGNNRFDSDPIIVFLGLKKGQEISIPGDDISNIIKKLWKQSQFEDISVYASKVTKDSVDIEISLKELTQLSEYEISGISESEADDIVKELKLNKGRMITKNLITETENYIRNKYINDGYLNTEVRVFKEEDLSDKKGSILKVDVNLQNAIKINDITFKGNNSIHSRHLKGEMEKTFEKSFWNWFKTSKFVDKDYREDLNKVIDYYKKNGYRDARISSERVYKFDDYNINIEIEVDEGKKYFYRDIKFVGNSKYTDEQLQSILKIEKDDVYDTSLLNKMTSGSPDGDDIKTLYLDQGHLFARVTPVEVSVKKDSVDVEIRIFEGEPVTINRVIVKGNTRTKDHVILREIRTRPGQLFSKTDLQRSFREISQLSFFDPEKIGIVPKPDPLTNTVDIEYSLVEKSSSQIELQGGWGRNQFIGSLGLSLNNLSAGSLFDPDEWNPIPMGDGQKISLRVQASVSHQTYSFSFTEPWLGGETPTNLSFSAHHTVQVPFDSRRRGRDSNSSMGITGVTVGLGKRLEFPDDYFVLYQSLNFKRYSLENYRLNLLSFSNGNSNGITYSVSLGRNSSGPSPIYPRTGSDVSVSIELTPPYSLFMKNENVRPGDDATTEELEDYDRKIHKWVEYYKVKIKNIWYSQVFLEDLVFRVGSEMGFINAYDNEILSPFERFYLGGDGLNQYPDGRENIGLRGYANNSLSTQEGATIYNKYNIELRYPVVLSPTASIYLLSFVEAGNSFLNFKDYDPFLLKRSAGFGARIFMPMFGMLGIDLGYGFDGTLGNNNKSGWQTHFVIGQQF
ncbi:outer membrane protein assembly factor BamA [Ichthyobacterium seriolicida]|uniref:Outer membrane protein assembly factor BamA n=1 Tax=Ichthyobacterium seriolicida TaxID=242600 RepID=A0A1J1EBF5_9FLAO|nr:outer membrane protein assembly factor BamA [Ichthyobacterium seriolicida]BAV94840.1 outer membrane protein assembly factor YaeT precursor [Ichthyobacterium seriolicida]